MKIKNHRTVLGMLATGLLLTFINTGYCQREEGPEESSGAQEGRNEEPEVYTTETMSGEVSWVGKNYISIVYDRNYDTGAEFEIMVPVTEKTVFKHIKGLKEIQQGDLVSIEYDKPVGKGKASARVIGFIQRNVSGLVSKVDRAGGE